MPSCRGRRARHAQKECIGSWEVPRLTSGNVTPWPASGRRGAEADDARTWEVGLCRTRDRRSGGAVEVPGPPQTQADCRGCDAQAMRKLLVLCFGVLKTGKPFDPAIAM